MILFFFSEQCGVPPVVSHALFYPSSNKKQFPEMTKVQYKCSKGYQQGGLSEAWCYQGKWRGPTMECKGKKTDCLVFLLFFSLK